jgi:DASH complex subunit DAD4
MAYQEKLNEAIMMLNKNLQEINIQNMDTELVAQMFKNYQSNVLFHLEGMPRPRKSRCTMSTNQ